MAVNANGNLIDDAGNVVVDHVWGNMPPQPNDVRLENGGGLLDPDLDNHAAYLGGWNGFPLYVPNSPGEYVDGVAYLVVPNVLGLTVVTAREVLVDAGFLEADITTAAAYTPAITAILANNSTNLVTLTTESNHGFAVGDEVVLAGLPNITVGSFDLASLNGTHTLVTGTDGTSLRLSTPVSDFLFDDENITGTAKVAAKAGTIFSQSLAAGADEVSAGDAITITPYYAS